METKSDVLNFLDNILQKRYEELKKEKGNSWRDDKHGREYIVCSLSALPKDGQYKLYKMNYNSKILPTGQLINKGQKRTSPLVPLPIGESKYFVQSAREYNKLPEVERLQESLNRGFPLIIEFEGYEGVKKEPPTKQASIQKNYLPTKEDIEFALSQLRVLADEVISPDAVLSKMEENFRKANKNLAVNWCEIAKNIIKTQFGR
jgi:hypothetical protein